MPASLSEQKRLTRLRDFVPPSPTSAYRVSIARCESEVEAAQRLRFRVFNLELGEGLASSEQSGLDLDVYDEVCDHLLIEHAVSGEVIGTYRLQTGRNAAAEIGYYSEQEFDFSPYEAIRDRTVELGRACIAKEHRNMVVLGLLWKGIAQYTKLLKARYLIGCSSITSTEPADGLAAYQMLQRCLVEPKFRTSPCPAFECRASEEDIARAASTLRIPRLMRAYLTLGAKICGEPALDRDFKTVDFLTLLDLDALGPRAMRKFLGE